ncbi:MAG: NAD(P)-dependent oxidoreductase [Lamprobacter sp.]|uniref:NAD-dependent epimerase/dehydratase family protein n=1 Tax=Lamprobacter sp. TaxID=3100796 RepID=UPI002B2566F6|nr:NAD(P)-dependent oxidoreductase [Lamprobacter sp.]MEA3642798.1 NAD(P)-dependent oxidoreductase [Lamprobacter sp.]
MIALTGATGFVGRQILRALVERDQPVRIIKRSSADSPGAPAARGGLEMATTADLFAETDAGLDEITAGLNTLIHAAWYAEPGQYLNSERNLDCLYGTLRLAQAFQRAGGRRFIGIGTCFEYDVQAHVLGTETPLRPGTLYAAAKASTFHLLSQLLPAAGIEFAWCRLFYLYGEGEDPRRLVPHLHARLSAGEPAELTSGRQIRDFLDVREAGERIADVALSERQGPLNICSGVPITVRQLAEQIADEYDRRDLLHFGVRPDNHFDPPCVLGIPNGEQYDGGIVTRTV